MAELNEKQAAFVSEYLIDLNATQAAVRAGYSEKTARAQGTRLLTNVAVSDAIAIAKAKRSQATGITQERVLTELAKIGFSDLRRAMTEGGALLDPQEWDDDTAGAIASLEVVTSSQSREDENGNKLIERVHKVKAWDKLAALDKLARHLGMLNGGGSGDNDAPSLNINITSSPPVGDVRVTRADR